MLLRVNLPYRVLLRRDDELCFLDRCEHGYERLVIAPWHTHNPVGGARTSHNPTHEPKEQGAKEKAFCHRHHRQGHTLLRQILYGVMTGIATHIAVHNDFLCHARSFCVVVCRFRRDRACFPLATKGTGRRTLIKTSRYKPRHYTRPASSVL